MTPILPNHDEAEGAGASRDASFLPHSAIERIAYPAGMVFQSLWPFRGPLIHVPTMREIAARVALEHGVTVEALKSRRQDRVAAWPRQQAMAEMHDTGLFSTPQIGRFFSRDHATVLFAKRAVARRQARALDQREAA